MEKSKGRANFPWNGSKSGDRKHRQQDCSSDTSPREQIRGKITAPAHGENGVVRTEARVEEKQWTDNGTGRIRTVFSGHDFEERQFLNQISMFKGF